MQNKKIFIQPNKRLLYTFTHAYFYGQFMSFEIRFMQVIVFSSDTLYLRNDTFTVTVVCNEVWDAFCYVLLKKDAPPSKGAWQWLIHLIGLFWYFSIILIGCKHVLSTGLLCRSAGQVRVRLVRNPLIEAMSSRLGEFFQSLKQGIERLERHSCKDTEAGKARQTARARR